MTENTLVSVVVAAFNAGPTLPRSIGSLLGQTHRNIEVVAVNDASTDDSTRILAELAARDARLKVQNLPWNVGVHAARRIGIRACRGAFIGFADGDDWAAPGMYAHLLDEAQRTGADIVICGAESVAEDGAPLPPKVAFPARQVFEDDLLVRFCRLEFGSGVQWNKLYWGEPIRRYSELELSRRYGDGPEDYIVNVGCFAAARRVVTLRERYYSYLIRSQGLSRAASNARAFLRVLGAYVSCLEAYHQEMPHHLPSIDELYARQLRFECYRVGSIAELPELAEGLSDCLTRVAAVRPESVYALVHAFDTVQSAAPVRPPLEAALRDFARSGLSLARTIARGLRPSRTM
jgi:glycosyltransferase involved in cell wall biosynthesis